MWPELATAAAHVAAAEVAAAEKLAAENLAAEILAAENLAAENLAAENLVAENLAAGKLAAENLAAENLAVEKLAADEEAGAVGAGAAQVAVADVATASVVAPKDQFGTKGFLELAGMSASSKTEMDAITDKPDPYIIVGVIRGKVLVAEQFHIFYMGTPNRNVVGGREKYLHADQTNHPPFRDANDECQPTGAGRGAHLPLLGAALGLLRVATRGG
jgi:hypothetical protein